MGTSARVMCDPKGRSKGFGFVCYKTPDEATKAVTEMHLKVVKGKPLYVGLAEKKEDRTTRLTQRYKGEKGVAGKGGLITYDQTGGKGGMAANGMNPGMMGQPQAMMGGMNAFGQAQAGKGQMMYPGGQMGMNPMGMNP